MFSKTSATCLAIAALLAFTPSPVAAKQLKELPLTVELLDPSSPETSMFRIVEWPSFLFTAEAPLSVPYVHQGYAPTNASVRAVGDLNCGDDGVGYNIRVAPGDPHGLDRDRDGVGCER